MPSVLAIATRSSFQRRYESKDVSAYMPSMKVHVCVSKGSASRFEAKGHDNLKLVCRLHQILPSG